MLDIPPLGLGTVKFGRNQQIKYPDPFVLPEDQEILKLLSVAQTLGMNHLDTAPAYGSSEERIGMLLEDRHGWIISSKTGETFTDGISHYDFTPEFTIASVERSLKRLRTDYIDIVFVHSDGSDDAIIHKYGTLDALAVLKQRGLIRSYGLSVKDPAAAVASLPFCEALMVEYHLAMTPKQRMATEALLEQAMRYNRLVCVKKALVSGHLDKIRELGTDQAMDPVEASLRFVFAHPSVKNVIIGSINPQHLVVNLEAYHRAINSIKHD